MDPEFRISKSTFFSFKQGKVTDSYVLGEKLGDGAYGSVFLGTHKTSGSVRAIKQIPKSRIREPSILEAEINIMREADSPKIVKIYEVYDENAFVSLVMDNCSGGELFSYIVSKKRLSEKEAAKYFIQILGAIKYLHSQNIVHRDLKPENILFDSDPNENSLLKLCDFGLAKRMTCAGETMNTRVGTPFYIAPEVLKGSYAESCDIWSCGVVLFILLAGYPPFYSQSESLILQKVRTGNYNFNRPEWNNVSEAAKDLIRHLLVVNPAERFTVDEALCHEWILAHEELSDEPLQLNVESLQEFVNSNRMRKAVLMCVASQCADSEISQLRQAFLQLDQNGDGVLSMDEIHQGLSHLQDVGMAIEDLMKSMDYDRNGKIDYTEFVAACLDKNIHLKEEKLASAFQIFDQDGSGKISASELRHILGKEDPHNQEFWEALVSEIDRNQDGEIDYGEFLALMTNKKREQLTN